jgi:hypothetical protein
MVTTMHGCSIVVTLELADNTTFATTNYLIRSWKLYSRTLLFHLTGPNHPHRHHPTHGMLGDLRPLA